MIFEQPAPSRDLQQRLSQPLHQSHEELVGCGASQLNSLWAMHASGGRHAAGLWLVVHKPCDIRLGHNLTCRFYFCNVINFRQGVFLVAAGALPMLIPVFAMINRCPSPYYQSISSLCSQLN